MGIEIIESSENILHILIYGDIDHHSSSDLRTEIDSLIETRKFKKFILDFSAVNFMDTSGIGLILGRFKLTSKYNIKMEVINANSRIKRIIEFSGIKSLGILK